MAYTPNIPQATDRFKDSQPLILGNFIDINTGFNLNHVAFNNGVDTGKHKFLQMPIQVAAPATNATEMGLYTKTGVTANPEMFIRRESNGTEIEFTARGNTGTNHYSMLPSGLLIKFGTASVAKGVNDATPGSTTITYDATIPFSSIISLYASATGNPFSGVGAGITNVSLTQANLYYTTVGVNGSSPMTVSYLVIGLP